MAQNITMKQVPNGTVTAKDDRIVYDANLADSGIIYGCDIAYIGNNMIHINAGYGIIKGGLFEIEDHTEYVEFAESGTLHGQIYLHLDLSADDKLTIVKETAASLHPMTQNANANFENGIYEMQLCTFEATATTLQNVTQTFTVVSAGVLDSLSEIAANTTGGLKAGALAVKELNNNLGNLSTQLGTFQFRNNGGNAEYRKSGADTWHPFSAMQKVTISGESGSYTFDVVPKYIFIITNWGKANGVGYSFVENGTVRIQTTDFASLSFSGTKLSYYMNHAYGGSYNGEMYYMY